MKYLRALAVAGALLLVIITVVPADERPVTGIQHDLEHLVAFLSAGCLFGYAFSTKISSLLLGAALFTLLIELAQIPLPTRHARVEDFLVDCAGMCLGVLLGRLARSRFVLP